MSQLKPPEFRRPSQGLEIDQDARRRRIIKRSVAAALSTVAVGTGVGLWITSRSEAPTRTGIIGPLKPGARGSVPPAVTTPSPSNTYPIEYFQGKIFPSPDGSNPLNAPQFIPYKSSENVLCQTLNVYRQGNTYRITPVYQQTGNPDKSKMAVVLDLYTGHPPNLKIATEVSEPGIGGTITATFDPTVSLASVALVYFPEGQPPAGSDPTKTYSVSNEGPGYPTMQASPCTSVNSVINVQPTQ
jgi:hypothetical protein